MMRRLRVVIPLLLFLITGSGELSAQYVGPMYRTLQFRLYGKDARPVTAADSNRYRVSIEWGEHQPNTFDYEPGPNGDFTPFVFCDSNWNVLEVGSDSGKIFPTFSPFSRFRIVHGLDTMRVKTYSDIQKLPFTPGAFSIPSGFAPLFELARGPDAILRPALEDFRVKNLDEQPGVPLLADSAMHVPEAINRPGAAILNVRLRDGNSGVLIVDVRADGVHTLVSPDGGNTWREERSEEKKGGTVLSPYGSFRYRWKAVLYEDGISRDLISEQLQEMGWELTTLQPEVSDRLIIAEAELDAQHRLRLLIDGARRQAARDSCVAFVNSMSRRDFRMSRSADNGNTWSLLFTGLELEPIDLRHNGRTVVALFDEGLLVSRDRGRRWRYYPLQPRLNSPLETLMSDSSHRWQRPDILLIDEKTVCLFNAFGLVMIDLGENSDL